LKLNILRSRTAAIVLLACGAIGAQAQVPSTAGPTTPQAPYTRILPDSIAREATVTKALAFAVAKKAVPPGNVASIELEREGGKPNYPTDVKTRGKAGIDEVTVDAKTGQMVAGVHHGGKATEAADANWLSSG